MTTRDDLNALANFKACAEAAPARCHLQAKAVEALIGATCETFMRDLRDMGLRANPNDLAFELEAALYRFAKQSNPMDSTFASAEGFGAAMAGPARERVLESAVADRDFLEKLRTGHPAAVAAVGMDAVEAHTRLERMR